MSQQFHCLVGKIVGHHKSNGSDTGTGGREYFGQCVGVYLGRDAVAIQKSLVYIGFGLVGISLDHCHNGEVLEV